MNDATWLSPMGPIWIGTLSRAYCERHGRFLETTGLCPTCQREAIGAAVQRCVAENHRRVSVSRECAERSEMYGL